MGLSGATLQRKCQSPRLRHLQSSHPWGTDQGLGKWRPHLFSKALIQPWGWTLYKKQATVSSLAIGGTSHSNREHLPGQMSASVRIPPPAHRRMGPSSGSAPRSRPSTHCPGKHTGSAVFVTFRLPFILKVPLDGTEFHQGRSRMSHAGAESTPRPRSGPSLSRSPVTARPCHPASPEVSRARRAVPAATVLRPGATRVSGPCSLMAPGTRVSPRGSGNPNLKLRALNFRWFLRLPKAHSSGQAASLTWGQNPEKSKTE